MDWLLIGDVLFLGAGFGGFWYLRRMGSATPARFAVLLVVSAAIFLFAPFYIAVGTDREGILLATVTTVSAVGIPLLILLALAASQSWRGR